MIALKTKAVLYQVFQRKQHYSEEIEWETLPLEVEMDNHREM